MLNVVDAGSENSLKQAQEYTLLMTTSLDKKTDLMAGDLNLLNLVAD